MAINDKKGHVHGKIGPLVYRSSGGTQIVQSRPRKFEQTEATKLTGHEFGLASTQAAFIRKIINTLIDASDGRMLNRFTSAIRNCLHIAQKAIGKRDLHDVNLDKLRGFQFNLDAPFERVMKKQPLSHVDDQGNLFFQLAIDDPYKDFAFLNSKRNATAGIRISTIAFNFKDEYFQVVDSKEFEVKTTSIQWESKKNLPSGAVIFVILSLHYYQTGWLTDLKPVIDQKYNASGILHAFHATEAMSNKGTGEEWHPIAQAIVAPTATKNKLKDIENVIIKEQKKKNKKLNKKIKDEPRLIYAKS